MVTALHIGWRHVLFANWPVDPDLLDAHLPDQYRRSIDTIPREGHPDDGVLWDRSHDRARTHEEQTSVEAADTGRYELRLEGDDVEGNFELRWDVSA